jgi:YHS domain-containing protein
VQGPEIWLNNLGIDVACVVDPSASAMLDEDHRVFVNYEAYYLSSSEALKAFGKEPWRYTGMVTDPVSKDRFQPGDKTVSSVTYGRLFYFSSNEHKKTFEALPNKYSTPEVPYAGRM